jgi:peptidoglycan/LPS O-acetylase OafA/YrhL
VSTALRPRAEGSLAEAAPAVSPDVAYRADVDGLRGIAVLAVVLYHAFPEWLPGGHAGVDVFFVISGFLITGLVTGALASGRFRFGDFLARRVRRLFPALLAMLCAALVAGSIVLLSGEYRQLAKHALAGTGFAANFVLLQEVGYFDNAASTKPLLHLWTLSIEEQFYLVWPALLAAAAWRGARSRNVAAGLLVLSLAAWALLHLRAPSASFYLPFTRAWELLAGAAIVGIRPSAGAAGPVRGVFGLAMIAAAFAVPGPESWAPLRSVVAVAGGALAITARGAPVRVLSTGWLVAIGLISYPLYLWHWPLLSFARIVSPSEPAAMTRLGLVAVSFVLAAATWHWIERPLRRRPAAGPGGVWRPLATAALIVAVAAAAILRLDGLPGRTSGDLARMLAAPAIDRQWDERARLIRMGECHYRPDGGSFEAFVAGLDACLDVPARGRHVLVVGDSLGADFRVALAIAYPDVQVHQLTMAGCQPGAVIGSDCEKLVGLAVAFAREHRPDAVLISTRWAKLPEIAGDGALARRIAAFGRHTRVVLVGPAAEFTSDVPALLGRMPPGTTPDDFASRHLSSARAAAARRLARIAAATGALYVDRVALYCGAPPRCPVTDGRHLLIADFGHLTPQGIDAMAQRLRTSALLDRIDALPMPQRRR